MMPNLVESVGPSIDLVTTSTVMVDVNVFVGPWKSSVILAGGELNGFVNALPHSPPALKPEER